MEEMPSFTEYNPHDFGPVGEDVNPYGSAIVFSMVVLTVLIVAFIFLRWGRKGYDGIVVFVGGKVKTISGSITQSEVSALETVVGLYKVKNMKVCIKRSGSSLGVIVKGSGLEDVKQAVKNALRSI